VSLARAGCTEGSLAGPGGALNADGGLPRSAYCDALIGSGGAQDGALQLQGAPLAFAPTTHGFGLSVVVQSGSPAMLGLRTRAAGAPSWGEAMAPLVRATDLAEWSVEGLAAGVSTDYQIIGWSHAGASGQP